MRRWQRRRRAFRLALRENQWLLPLLGAVAGALLAVALSEVDRDPDPGEWAITVSRARDTLMSILAILFAGLAIVLSLAAMTAQTVASRFSLRLVRVYLRGLADKTVLAIFVATTVFIVIEQARMASLGADELAPRVSVYVSASLLIVSGGAIIWYINHVLQAIRVDRTVRRVTAQARRTAAAVDRRREHYDTAPSSALDPPPDSDPLVASASGYVTSIDIAALGEVAATADLTLGITPPVGSFVVVGEPLGWVVSTGTGDLNDGIISMIALQCIHAWDIYLILLSEDRTDYQT